MRCDAVVLRVMGYDPPNLYTINQLFHSWKYGNWQLAIGNWDFTIENCKIHAYLPQRYYLSVVSWHSTTHSSIPLLFLFLSSSPSPTPLASASLHSLFLSLLSLYTAKDFHTISPSKGEQRKKEMKEGKEKRRKERKNAKIQNAGKH